MAEVKKRRRGYTRLSSKRQVTIPIDALRQTGLAPGDELKVDVDRAGRIVLSRAHDREARLRAIEETAGAFTGVYEPDSLERLRNEWR